MDQDSKELRVDKNLLHKCKADVIGNDYAECQRGLSFTDRIFIYGSWVCRDGNESYLVIPSIV